MRAFHRSLFLLCAFCVLCGECVALDRNAFTFTDYNLNVRIDPGTAGFSVDGKVRVRNDSNSPQKLVDMQISSSLAWKKITAGGKAVQWLSQAYVTDTDHTGSVTEAIITLPQPVPPRDTAELEIAYDGTVGLDTTRLERAGIPRQDAANSDWDQVGADYSAVRGLGYVVWYPVAMESVSLANGNEVFDAIARWQQRESGMPLLVGFSGATPGTTWQTNGGVGHGCAAGKAGTSAECVQFQLGQVTPTFAVGTYKTLAETNIRIDHLPERASAAADYMRIGKELEPFATEWFGPAKEMARLIDLEPEGDALYESGAVMFTPLRATDSKSLELEFAHQLTHASLPSSREWIFEGAASFAQVVEREQQDGRAAALGYMVRFLPTLQNIEKQLTAPAPAKSGQPTHAPGEPMIAATDEVMYRIKAMYVWWMLRDMLGDPVLKSAFQTYRAADDKDPTYMQKLLEAQAHRSLQSFFEDWVYNDRGLPDFKIDAVYPRPTMAGAYTVTVTVENLGPAGAEVPVIVKAEGGERVKRVDVPARGKAVVHIQVPTKPVEAVVNDGSVPESDRKNNSMAITVPQE